MRRNAINFLALALCGLAIACLCSCGRGCDTDVLADYPAVSGSRISGGFDLVTDHGAAPIYVDAEDARVVSIAADMLADDIERVTGVRPQVHMAGTLEECSTSLPSVIAGTIGQSRIVDRLVSDGIVDVDCIRGKWEAFTVATVTLPSDGHRALVIAGSDRRGTAYGLTSLSRAMGVSPWYWWADVTPGHRDRLYVQPGIHVDAGPSVQYRGIFINDERFGGWARWVENTFDTETHEVGPKVYAKVFELLLRLKGNYLWPAMHNGSRAFNAYPENARLADDFAIVMGSSHCEQMLRNNEDEWKNVGTYGDFNYMTNRQTMIDYWEERVRTNGGYENTYTLGLRGIHDYPMEGANTNEQRVALMQQALDDQREILRRNIDRPLEDIPQLLCTYEEVLEAYHSGLVVPDDVTLLWSDDKHGYTRNLSNPSEMERSGGAGIYYHLSYHGDPASWIWLSPLSPAFISTELTKAYTYGARKVWVFNVGDIKPAEKEISFAMDLAWDVERWNPQRASTYIQHWAEETFGEDLAPGIASVMDLYYRMMASGKDSHVWFVEYSEGEIFERLGMLHEAVRRAELLLDSVPGHLKDAYFELVLYPVRGAYLLNTYQLDSRLSLANATVGRMEDALRHGAEVLPMYDELNAWTRRYNEEVRGGKWRHFFNWRPYHWYYSDSVDVQYCTRELADSLLLSPAPRMLDVADALSPDGVAIDSETDGYVKLWAKALTPVRNFSKSKEDNVFATVSCGDDTFEAAAIPINNVWHSPMVGPRWCEIGTLHLNKGINYLKFSDVVPEARIDQLFIGLYPFLPEEPLLRVAAEDFDTCRDADGNIVTIGQLGYSDGVTVLPFDTPSYDVDSAPYVEYDVMIPSGATSLEVRTLPTLHVYEGRDIRYALQVDGGEPSVFSIHEGDFTSGWRLNVMRGYALRSVSLDGVDAGHHTIRISLLDPGVVLQEIIVR